MKKRFCGFLPAFLVTVFLASASMAELGLQGLLSSQGARAVGEAVKGAAEAVIASGENADAIANQLTAIMNEATSTGDDSAIQYAIVALMTAGGEENMSMVESAIRNSSVMGSYASLVDATIGDAKSLISGDTSGNNGGGDTGGDGGDSGGGQKPDPESTPTGPRPRLSPTGPLGSNPFDNTPTDDGDVDATRT
jgi:hypothetical protein